MSAIQVSVLVFGGAGFIFALFLFIVNKQLKVEENPLVSKVLDILPGINCGACGFSGCRVFAEAVVRKKNIFSGCLPGGDKINQSILDALGIEERYSRKKIAVVCHCSAEGGEKKVSSVYQGPFTCQAADMIGGGGIDCLFGCIGFGDCVKVCAAGAVTIKNQKVYVDLTRCTGCGKCISACPRNLFERLNLENKVTLYYVGCNNKERGVKVKAVCTRGCIGCGICVRVEDSPFYLKENLSCLDYDKIDKEESLASAKKQCPTKCIIMQIIADSNICVSAKSAHEADS